MSLIFCMHISMKVSYRLILWFLIGMVKYSQSSENSKFAMFLNISKKKLEMKLIFRMQINIKISCKLISTLWASSFPTRWCYYYWWARSSAIKVLKVTILQYLYNISKEKLGMEFIFCMDYKLELSFLMEVARHVQSTQIKKLIIFSLYVEKKVSQLHAAHLCSLLLVEINFAIILILIFIYVLSLLDKHFLSHNKSHKVLNRNTVKISYSCVPNMKTITNSYNYKITNPNTITKNRTCNCVDKAKCPLSQNCLVSNIIYKVVLTSTNRRYKEKIYFGLAETKFKLQYTNHPRSFKFLKDKTNTESSNKEWRMKKSRQTPVIKWEIVRKCSSYKPNSKRCYLCLNEKLEIATYRENNLLNEKTELMAKCRRQNKYTLSKYDTKDWLQV